jgi:hypothetical protein
VALPFGAVQRVKFVLEIDTSGFTCAFVTVASLVVKQLFVVLVTFRVYIPAAILLIEEVEANKFEGNVFCPLNHSKVNPEGPPVTDPVRAPFGVRGSQLELSFGVAMLILGKILLSSISI